MKPWAQLHPLVNEAMSYQQHWHYWRHSNTHLDWFLKSSFNDLHFYDIMKTELNIPPGKQHCLPKRDHVKRKCHLPTIDFSGDILVFRLVFTRRFTILKQKTARHIWSSTSPVACFLNPWRKTHPGSTVTWRWLETTWEVFFSPKKMEKLTPPKTNMTMENHHF